MMEVPDPDPRTEQPRADTLFIMSDSDSSGIQKLVDVPKPIVDTAVQKRLSAFAEHDLVIKIENTKLYVNKEQLMAESSVFKEKLATLSKDLPTKEIDLEDTSVKTFVDFLRSTLPGIDENMTDGTVHDVLPLANEYAATKTLNKADMFLAEKCKRMGNAISSEQVVKNMLQAELYNLSTYLEECITIASRKRFKNLVKIQQFNDISQETRLKIATKRWNDMDTAIETSGKWNELTHTEDFYQPYPPLPTTQAQFGTPGMAFGAFGGGFGVQPIKKDFVSVLTPFMHNN